jgi:hypothetical protein
MKKTILIKQCKLIASRLFLLILIGFLSSCQHDEIIALEEENIDTELITGDLKGSDMVYLGKDGKPVDSKSIHGNSKYSPLITLHDNDKFGGQKLVIFADTNTNTFINLGFYNFNDRTTSLTVPPGCNVKMYQHGDETGNSFNVNNYNQSQAKYVTLHTVVGGKSLNNSVGNNQLSSLRITCNPNKATKGRLCAFADKSYNTNTSSGKQGFPIYYNSPISYSHLHNWSWKGIKSVVLLANNRCSTVGDGISFLPNRYDKISANETNAVIKKSTSKRTWNLFALNSSVKSIVPDGNYANTNIFTSSEAQSVNTEMVTNYDKLDSSKGTLTAAEIEACDAVYEDCIDIAGATKVFGYLSGFACPTVILGGGSYTTYKSFNDGHWRTGLADAFSTAVLTGVEIVAMVENPRVAAASCYYGTTLLALGYGKEASCNIVKNKCLLGLG